ncbi:MAG: hypothetical protein DRN15_11150 [Thermoprotei archaeon]|nr:MAG: hypothetical protein DRN15_11150 [Thermoprotei archaeon]RLF24035.1 MAG: hypothetical protein DRM97_03985 [Thermoprotei archaeon]
MGFAKAHFRIKGMEGSLEGLALVDTGAWYTVIDEEVAGRIGVEYTGLEVMLTSFTGHRIPCREAIVKFITIEERTAPSELVAICTIPHQVKKVLRKHEVEDYIVIGVHTLERLRYAVDIATHRLVESPGVLMI